MIILINTELKYTKIFLSLKYFQNVIGYFSENLFITLTDFSTQSSAIIFKSDFSIYSNSSCSFYAEIFRNQSTYQYYVSMTEGIHQAFSGNSSWMTVVVFDYAEYCFNVSQTSITVFDLFVTDLFWPQTIASSNNIACQMIPPQLLNSQVTWNLSESNLELNYKPFYHCQNVPIIISEVIVFGIDSTLIKVNRDEIVIQYMSNQRMLSKSLDKRYLTINPGESFVLNITAETNTIIPQTNIAQISFYVNNTAPNFISYPNTISIQKPQQEVLNILYGYLNDSNVANPYVAVSDSNSDSIYLSVAINGNSTSNQLFILNTQNNSQFITLDTSELDVGSNNLHIEIWDMFHSTTPSQININLSVIYNPAPYFSEPLPSNLSVQICSQTKIILPPIKDDENDFVLLKLLNSKDWVMIQNLNLIMDPTFSEIGLKQISLSLVDFQNNSRSYFLDVNIIDTFEFSHPNIPNQTTIYPNPLTFNISEAVSQFKSNNITIEIKELGKTISWGIFNSSSQSIVIQNYKAKNIGNHSLTTTINVPCYTRSFDFNINANIISNFPPSIVGTIEDVIGYQGQTKIIQKNIFVNNLFYDQTSDVKIVLLGCKDEISGALITSDSKYIIISSTIETIFYKSYVGKCKASILGYNNLYQTSIIFYNFTILVCPQQNCLYCEGSEKTDCTKCKFGYTLNFNTNECESADTFVDKWIIIGFTICTVLATIFTKYDTDICILLLEHISMYFILFMSSNSSNLVASSYFKEVLVVISNMSPLLFPLYRQQFNIFNATYISRYFILNCSAMVLLTVSLTIIRRCINNSLNRNSSKSYYISKLIAKYLVWNSCFMLFCALYEIEDAQISLAKILSLTFTTIWILTFLSFTYCVVLNYESECCICFRFKWMKQAKLELIMVSYLNSMNYRYYIKYNFMRKILYPVIMSLTINYSISPYIFTVCIISLQIMYFCLSFGVCIFDSYMKRMQIVINESLMIFIILITTIIFMNSRNQDINNFTDYSIIVLDLIRIQILGTIAIESIRMITL